MNRSAAIGVALVAVMPLSMNAAPARAASGPNLTRLVSVTPQGQSGNGGSGSPAVTPGGRFVAFASTATNLVAATAHAPSRMRIYLRDMVRNRTTLVSASVTGGDLNASSYGPTVSDDGRYVAFTSDASNAVHGDRNGHSDVFVRDLKLRRTSLVSRSMSGRSGNGASDAARISGNGDVVVFESEASDLVPGDGNGQIDIFADNRFTGATTRVSESRTHGDANGASTNPVINQSGRFVAFSSTARNLIAGYRRTGMQDIFWRDIFLKRTVQMSPETSTGPRGTFYLPAISGDGKTVAFLFRGIAPAPRNLQLSVGIRELRSGAFSDFGIVGYIAEPLSLDGNGQRLTFFTCARNCSMPRSNGIIAYDRASGKGAQVDVSRGPVQGADSGDAMISNDGRFAVFASGASNLARPDNNRASDVFLRRLTF